MTKHAISSKELKVELSPHSATCTERASSECKKFRLCQAATDSLSSSDAHTASWEFYSIANESPSVPSRTLLLETWTVNEKTSKLQNTSVWISLERGLCTMPMVFQSQPYIFPSVHIREGNGLVAEKGQENSAIRPSLFAYRWKAFLAERGFRRYPLSELKKWAVRQPPYSFKNSFYRKQNITESPHKFSAFQSLEEMVECYPTEIGEVYGELSRNFCKSVEKKENWRRLRKESPAWKVKRMFWGNRYQGKYW